MDQFLPRCFIDIQQVTALSRLSPKAPSRTSSLLRRSTISAAGANLGDVENDDVAVDGEDTFDSRDVL